jgi:2-iminobutanoate/2-iminopropanoate deaminase
MPEPSPAQYLSPPGSVAPTGPWSVAALDTTTNTLYIAGMRGIDPATNRLVEGDEARIRQAFLNMRHIAESRGATLRNCLRLVVYVTDMARHRPIANRIQEDLWEGGPYPPRTIVEVRRLNDDDIFEVEGTFRLPA